MNLRVISTPAKSALSSPVLTAEEAVAVAKSLAPKFAERAAHAEKIRRVPEESIEELNASGLLRLMQPKRFGGSELGLGALMDVVLEICKGCSSTAWAYSIWPLTLGISVNSDCKRKKMYGATIRLP